MIDGPERVFGDMMAHFKGHCAGDCVQCAEDAGPGGVRPIPDDLLLGTYWTCACGSLALFQRSTGRRWKRACWACAMKTNEEKAKT